MLGEALRRPGQSVPLSDIGAAGRSLDHDRPILVPLEETRLGKGRDGMYGDVIGPPGVPLGRGSTDPIATCLHRCTGGVAGAGLAGRGVLHTGRDTNVDHCRFELQPQNRRLGVTAAVVVHDRSMSPGT